MWLSQQERLTLSVLGMVALLGLSVSLWQRQRRPLSVVDSPAPAEAAAWDRRLSAARQVDVNTADAAELERLPGVGPTLAARIVQDRAAHGPFTTTAELARVPGIGPKMSEALKEYITTVNE